MIDMYTDIERSIERSLSLAIPVVSGLKIAVFNNQVTKKDYPNQHGAININKVTDIFQPGNGGGQSAILRDAIIVDGAITGYHVSNWPDPFDIMYQLEVTAETCTIDGLVISGLSIVRACDSLIRSVFRPRQRMMIWDSDLNAGAGGWNPTSYVNYEYAGYINRDSPATEIYNRVTNIRFEVFNYSGIVLFEPAILQVPELTI